MTDNTIKIIEKEDPPRKKEEFSTLTIRIRPHNPNVIMSEQAKKGASLKFAKPLVKKIEGPFDQNNELVDEIEVDKTYIFKATKFKESTFTPIKHIWFAEQIDDGEVVDLEYKKGENPYLDDNGVVCFKYKVKECDKVRIYAYVAKPIKKVSVETSVISNAKMYFVAGAGNDTIGWNYTQRFDRIWTELGISGFEKTNVPSGTNYGPNVPPMNDMIYSLQYRNEPVENKSPMEGTLAITEKMKTAHRRVREKIVKDIKNHSDFQLNLAGYSYGSVVVCQTAIQLVGEGITVDNLVLIGSPVNMNSNLYKKLLEFESSGKICQIIRYDIPNDYFSNTDGIGEIWKGVKQNSGESGEHFDLARPDDPQTPVDETIEVDKKIRELGELLISKGIK